jgi:di/tricarboxylate transporter
VYLADELGVKDDFDQFLWTIVFIAMGGIALGKGVMSSGLLEVLDGSIRRLVDGFELYTVVLILSLIVLVSPFSAPFRWNLVSTVSRW